MSGCRAFSWRLIDNFSVSIHRLIPLCSTFAQSVCRCRQKLPPFCIIGYAYVVCSEIRCCFRFFKFIGANTDCNQCANDHSRNKKGKNQPKVIHCNTSAINRFYGRTSLFTVSVSATNPETVFKSAFPFRKSAAVFWPHGYYSIFLGYLQYLFPYCCPLK